MKDIASRLEGTASRLEAIASMLEAVASRLEAITIWGELVCKAKPSFRVPFSGSMLVLESVMLCTTLDAWKT